MTSQRKGMTVNNKGSGVTVCYYFLLTTRQKFGETRYDGLVVPRAGEMDNLKENSNIQKVE